MKLAVLGAGGLLGRHLVEELRGEELVALDRAACDVGSAGEVLARTRGAQVIVNCAAFTDVDGAESRADECWRANALGAEHAALAARAHGAVLVHVSTDFVFDGEQQAPYDEFARPNPQSVYARSKFAGEELIARVGGPQFLVRVQALYGRGGRGFSSRLRDLVRERKPLKLDRERRVQPTWARAAARQIAVLTRSSAFGTYHVSCRGETTWAAFSRALASRLGVEPAWSEVATAELRAPAARPRNCVFEHRMLALRGLDVMPDWQTALDDYLAEMK
ncbi:MAG TPA: dTDP-4-dehydrorhamnose reductase [Polyangia bacterium]|nr:dTDP-4-dehydrorhamnose reductase [Polyangia bacterium]